MATQSAVPLLTLVRPFKLRWHLNRQASDRISNKVHHQAVSILYFLLHCNRKRPLSILNFSSNSLMALKCNQSASSNPRLQVTNRSYSLPSQAISLSRILDSSRMDTVTASRSPLSHQFRSSLLSPRCNHKRLDLLLQSASA